MLRSLLPAVFTTDSTDGDETSADDASADDASPPDSAAHDSAPTDESGERPADTRRNGDLSRWSTAESSDSPSTNGHDASTTASTAAPAPDTAETATATGPADIRVAVDSPLAEAVAAGEYDAQVGFDAVDTTLDRPADIHHTLVAPSGLTEHPQHVATGQRVARTLWIGEYPGHPDAGLLEHLYAGAETQETDITLHLDPRDTNATLDRLKNRIEDLRADYEYLAEKQRADARGVKKDLEDHQELYDVLRNTSMTAFDVSMYVTVRGDNADAVASTADAVAKTARQAPANLTPVTPRWLQLDALEAASPIARDRLQETLDAKTPMLAGAVGAMFPFVAGAFAEPGIEYGTYALNESPVVLDRFNRETGYCMMVVGKLGAGKSFATKLQLLRRAMFDEDAIIVMLDPLQGFAGLAEALDAEHITVGGTRGLNPLEIRAPATDTAAVTQATDLDPWAAQITKVMAFFDLFFEQVAKNPLGDRSQTLRRAVQEAYEGHGITRDPATHDRPSPTIRDVIGVLEQLLDAPAEFGYRTQGEQEAVRADVKSLLTDLRPSFRPGGDLANLAEQTAFDLESNVVYLDLHQQEGIRGRTETSLMMQVLFNIVYERAKATDKRVLFTLDEAHYLLSDDSTLAFLETAVRHSRHYDLSIQFVTQTGGEFTLTPEARTIANLCSLTMLHRVDEDAEKLIEWFGLNRREANWVRTAKAGEDEEGYSEALLGIDEVGWLPLRIRASPREAEVIDQPPTSY